MKVKVNSITLLLFVILLIGAAVRLAGINYLLIPDESMQLYRCLKIGRLEFIPNWFFGIYSYIMFVFYSVFFIIGLGFGWFSSLHNFLGRYFTDPHIFYLAGRTAESLAGIAGIYAMYLLGKSMFNKTVGVMGALFLALNVTHVKLSQSARGGAFAALFSILALFFIYLTYQRGKLRDYVLAGLFIAAAASIRIYFLGLFVPLLVVFIYSLIRERVSAASKRSRIFFRFFLCIVVFIVATCVFTPDFVFDFEYIKSILIALVLPLAGPDGGEPNFLGLEMTNGWSSYLLDLLPASFGWPLYILSILSVLFALFSWRQCKHTLLAAFIICYIAVIGKSGITATRYMMPIFPAFFLLAAHVLSMASRNLFKQEKMQTIFIFAITLLLVLPSAVKSVELDISRWKMQTQDVANEWILKNIPDRARIAVESTGYAGPNIRLYSMVDYDLYRMSKEKLEQLYAERKKSEKSGSLALRYFIDHPPKPWHRVYDLNIKQIVSLDYLKGEKIEYFVTSSSVYDLYDTPHSRTAYPDLVQSKMKFYNWLEEEGDLIKVFKPSKQNPGPEIKVYKIAIQVNL